ncbi:MAG TPA: sterol desaturase family protein [Planctomycetaceae bacterium]|nr:sterol desaturase family protein [Planctomycetaceae bacterium]
MQIESVPWLEASLALVLALAIGSLAEYLVHRLMHTGRLLGKTHARHHQDGDGQGWFLEFWDYLKGTLAILWVGFLYSVPAGIGFATGGLLYAMLAAYAHQIQHERPEMVFWMKRPVHYLHHKHHMWKHNFGILVDVWDRVFGTYRVVEWVPERRPFQHPLSDFLRIKWF